MQKIHFYNLDGIRAILSFMVVVHHIEQLKRIFKLPDTFDVQPIGYLGIQFFFVLSGFLITYLLVQEKTNTSRIYITHFYIRRIYRIWPLYFMVILLSLFILPSFLSVPNFDILHIQSHLGQKILLFSFFMSNIVLVRYGAIPFAAPTWSIAVEEQFYLVWPLIFQKFRKPFMGILFFSILYYSIKFCITYFSFSNKFIFPILVNNSDLTPMIIGGLVALISLKKFEIKTKISIIISLFITLSILYLSVFVPNPESIEFIYCPLFACLLWVLVMPNNKFKLLDNPLLNYLGKISYGIYLLHSIAIVVSIKLLTHLNGLSNFLLYSLTIILTISFASISFHYFEKYFLSLKPSHKGGEILKG
jgi:peptidoglycan/LPS O-acetylase OafA/YrhL